MYPRLPPRLPRLFPSNPVFFVTLCTYRRRKLLVVDVVNASFIQFAERAYAKHNIAVGRYVIMPDHVHLFITGTDDFELGRWIGGLNQFMAKSMGREKTSEPLWQRGFFDHVLRSEESYGQKWNYVRDNPVRAGLVASADAWPYAGEIIVIDRL
jgi:putative transposase